MTPPRALKPTRAVVIGASVAGLCAAAALRAHFDEVVLVEKDRSDETVAYRRGTPQAHFVHSLLERGRREMETLFPGFTLALSAAGVPELDFGLDVAALRASGWMLRQSAGLKTFWPSRPLIDAILRRGLTAMSAVRPLDQTAVIGLILSEGAPRRCTGVLLREAGETRQLSADLIVDASGRGSRLPAWLRAADVAPPPEEVVDAGAGYSARHYLAPDPANLPNGWWWKGVVVECAPPDIMAGGVLFPIEGGRWLITLMGFNGFHPPSDEAGFDAFAANLRSPLIAQAMALAKPVTPIVASRSLANRLRRLDRWPQAPAGLVVVGDAACAMNPIYGQGMALASGSAALLGESVAKLDPRHPDFARRFHTAQARFLSTPWRMSTASDFCYPQTRGVRPVGSRLRDLYLNAVFEAAWADPVLQRKITRVIHLIDDPLRLYSPNTAARMLLRRAAARRQPPAAAAPIRLEAAPQARTRL